MIVGTATATTSGSVTISPSSPLSDGSYLFHLVAIDRAGNVSAPSGLLESYHPRDSSSDARSAESAGRRRYRRLERWDDFG